MKLPLKFEKFFSDVSDGDPELKAAMEAKGIVARKIPRLSNDGQASVCDADGEIVAFIPCKTPYKRGEGHKSECPIRDEIANGIVRAVNYHDELVAVLRAVEEHQEYLARQRKEPLPARLMNQIAGTLAKVQS